MIQPPQPVVAEDELGRQQALPVAACYLGGYLWGHMPCGGRELCFPVPDLPGFGQIAGIFLTGRFYGAIINRSK